MSYQKKSKSRFVYIFLLIFTPLLILSFTSRKSPKSQKKSNQVISRNLINEATGINYLQCVRMDSTLVAKYLREGAGNKRVILELFTNNITSADPKFNVYSYLAKNHRTHAIDVTPDTLPYLENCLPLKPDTTYIIGNNYVTIQKLKNFIANRSYTYLKFSPFRSATNHIFFRFSAYRSIKGKEDELISIPVKPFSGLDETNPCPPNKPND